MTHTEATHTIQFSFNNLLDAMPADATPGDAAALAMLFAIACNNADNTAGSQAFTGLNHQLMVSQQRRDARPAAPINQPAGNAVDQLKQLQSGFKAVRPGGCSAVGSTGNQVVPAQPAGEAGQPNQLIDTILKAMGPQIQAEAERRIAARQGRLQQ